VIGSEENPVIRRNEIAAVVVPDHVRDCGGVEAAV
jgi:hypothetical protein